MKPLEQVIADRRSAAQVLRVHGHEHDADLIDSIMREVAESAEPYITWLSEADARLYSGLATRTLRRRFGEMLDAGNARHNAKHEREYRAAALPRRPDVAAAHEAGRRGKRVA